MTVFKTFLRIFRRKLPDSSIYFIVFLVLSILMSKSVSDESEQKFTASSVDIVFMDEDQSDASMALTAYLSGLHRLTESDLTDVDTLQDQLFYQEIAYILRIPKGFEEALLSGETEELLFVSYKKSSGSGYFVDQQINSYLSALSRYLAGGCTIPEASSAVTVSLENTPEVQFATGNTGNTSHPQIYYYYLYLPYILIMVLLTALSPVLTAFHRKDLAERIDCSALPRNSRNVQLYLGSAVCSFFLWAVFVLVSAVVYGPGNVFQGGGLYHLLNSFVFLLFIISLALIIGLFPLTDNARNMIANVAGLGMGFLSGLFVPQMYLGEGVLTAARFLPMYWYIKAAALIESLSPGSSNSLLYFQYLGIEMLFVAAVFCIYLVVGKQRKK